MSEERLADARELEEFRLLSAKEVGGKVIKFFGKKGLSSQSTESSSSSSDRSSSVGEPGCVYQNPFSELEFLYG